MRFLFYFFMLLTLFSCVKEGGIVEPLQDNVYGVYRAQKVTIDGIETSLPIKDGLKDANLEVYIRKGLGLWVGIELVMRNNVTVNGFKLTGEKYGSYDLALNQNQEIEFSLNKGMIKIGYWKDNMININLTINGKLVNIQGKIHRYTEDF